MEEATSISLGLMDWGGEEEEGHPLIGPTDLPNQMDLEVVITFHQGLVFHRERTDAMLPNSAPSFHSAPNSEHMSLVDGFWALDTRFYVANFLDLELKIPIPAPI